MYSTLKQLSKYIFIVYAFAFLLIFKYAFYPKFPFVVHEEAFYYSDSDPDLACRIPQLQPFSHAVTDHLKGEKLPEGCDKNPRLFESTLDGRIVPVGSFSGVSGCCYQSFGRKNDPQNKTENCHPLSLVNSTEIQDEFISITCDYVGGGRERVDLHSFIRIKPEVEKQLKRKRGGGVNRTNVVIFGIDAVSRMSFIRSMKASRAYLMDELGAVEMTGYNKVADNTRPNLVPLFTSMSYSEVRSSCKSGGYYDSCPFIWKSFGEKGYYTSFAEDKVEVTIFYMDNGGFKKQPTDYYFRPFAMQAWRWLGTLYSDPCYGPRLSFQVLLDKTKKLMYEMNRMKIPFFDFTWSSALTHDYARGGEVGDRHLLDMLKWMKNSEYLNNTVFILMSDHGSRNSGLRNSIQGQLEDRLPFIYFLLPDWMKRGDYSRAYQNLLGNRNRLVTVYDIHQVLLDILNLDGIQNNQVARRERELSERNSSLPRGISLFLPIPKHRTCQMANIDPNFCACKSLRLLKSNSSAVVKAASIAVDKINSILNSTKSECANLTLSSVIMAQYAGQRDWKGIQVNFETKPGNGTFEALVATEWDNDWKVDGMISRTNLYGNQSHCVDSPSLKLYCYCL